MTSKTESVILAVVAMLEGITSPDRTVIRGGELPEEIGHDVLYLVRDGDPGEPEEMLGIDGPWFYNHDVEIEVYVAHVDKDKRNKRFDDALTAIETVHNADRTVGGNVKGALFRRPESTDDFEEGAATVKAGTVLMRLEYQSPTRL